MTQDKRDTTIDTTDWWPCACVKGGSGLEAPALDTHQAPPSEREKVPRLRLNKRTEPPRGGREGVHAMSEWQPISTAPKDMGFLLAYNADRRVHGLVCWWPGGGWNGDGCWGWDKEPIAWSRQRGNQPTHWMPLPEPPQEPT